MKSKTNWLLYRSKRKKFGRAKAWIALGPDNSILDSIEWYRDEHDLRWFREKDVKVIPCTITYVLPRRRKL